jgi:hypothetical protein
VEGGNPSWVAGDYAGIGFSLNNASTYSLLGYTGLAIQIESQNPVIIVIQELNGYEFTTEYAGAVGSDQTKSYPFTSFAACTACNKSEPANAVLDLTQVTDIEFQVSNLTSFGFAVHQISLY